MNINATLFVQIAVFVALWWFTAKFVWPPIVKSLDERSKRIADGLAAADKAKADLASAERRVADELKKARDGAAEVRSGAERAQTDDETASDGNQSNVGHDDSLLKTSETRKVEKAKLERTAVSGNVSGLRAPGRDTPV